MINAPVALEKTPVSLDDSLRPNPAEHVQSGMCKEILGSLEQTGDEATGVLALTVVEVGDCFHVEEFVKESTPLLPFGSVLTNCHAPRTRVHTLSPKLMGNRIQASQMTHSSSIGIVG